MNPMEYYLKRARKVKYSKEDYKNSYPVGGSDYYHDFDPTVHPINNFTESGIINNGHESFDNRIFDSSKNELAHITHEPIHLVDQDMIGSSKEKSFETEPDYAKKFRNGIVRSKIKLLDNFHDLDDNEKKKVFSHILDNIAHVNTQYNLGSGGHALFNFQESNHPLDLSEFDKNRDGDYVFDGKPSLWNVPDELLDSYGHPNDATFGRWDEYLDRWKNQDFTKITPESIGDNSWLNLERPLIDSLYNHVKNHLKNSIDYKRFNKLISSSTEQPSHEDLIQVADTDFGDDYGSLKKIRENLHYNRPNKNSGDDIGETFTKMGYPHLDWILNLIDNKGQMMPDNIKLNDLRDILRKNGHKNTDIEHFLFPETAEVVEDDEE